MSDPTSAAPTPPPDPGPAQEFGSWGARVVAAILDGIPVAVVYVVLALLFGDNTAGGGSFSTSLTGFAALVYYVVAIAWFVYNWGFKQGGTGQTWGKGVLNIAVYKAGTRQPLGTGLSIGRQFVHILDSIPCLIGYLWPLWDKENRTFADMILDTRVYKA